MKYSFPQIIDFASESNIQIINAIKQASTSNNFFLLVNQTKVYTYKLPTYTTNYAPITGPEITLAKSAAQRVDVYIWYDGTNGLAKNENAVNNPLNFSVSHAFKLAA